MIFLLSTERIVLLICTASRVQPTLNVRKSHFFTTRRRKEKKKKKRKNLVSLSHLHFKMLRCLQLDVITAAAAGTQMNEFAAQLERAVS